MQHEYPILIVEDDADCLEMMGVLFGCEGYQVLSATDFNSAKAAIDEIIGRFIVILDKQLDNGDDGLSVLKYVKDEKKQAIVYFYSGLYDGEKGREAKLRAYKEGALVYLHKPVDPDELLACVANGEQLLNINIRDNLTGAYTRAEGEYRLEMVYEHARRNNLSVACVFIDIDDLKPVNDQISHAAGDKLLIETVKRAKVHLRRYDFVYRQGGDEFVLVLPGADLEETQKIVKRIRRDLTDKPVEVVEGTFRPLKASFGCRVHDKENPTRNFEELVSHADTAMYAEKRANKARVVNEIEDVSASSEEK
jgi:two-component system cell cycle response regulator